MAVYALGEAQPVLGENAWVADSAQVMGRIALGKHTSVWFNSTLIASAMALGQ